MCQQGDGRTEGTVANDSRISIVDDDASMREALRGLLKSAGFTAEVFSSAEEILSSGRLNGTSCLILDVRMPGMSGIELQERLIASGNAVPIVFITAHAEEAERARAMERGAIDCLQKPFSEDALLDAISKGIDTTSAS
jgi:FixJ family two-component response regulator